MCDNVYGLSWNFQMLFSTPEHGMMVSKTFHGGSLSRNITSIQGGAPRVTDVDLSTPLSSSIYIYILYYIVMYIYAYDYIYIVIHI